MLLLAISLLIVGCFSFPALAQDELVIGLILIGPRNDHGWSQAHYEGALYVEENLPGTSVLVFESLNTADAPETTLLDVVTEMVDQGAKLILTTSDAFEEDTLVVAQAFPDITFINVSGDDALTGEAPENLGNVMGQMEWGKLIAGCAAGLQTQTGKIGYLGPLINHETLRLASSSYLGARYCYEEYKGGDPEDLEFTVTWIGFWFNIPGVTLDPNEVANNFFDSGVDVVISGIDTTEAITVAAQRASQGEAVWAIPYDYVDACALGEDVCLGTPYFRWGPAYLEIARSVMEGTWEQSWDWLSPDWSDINNPDTSHVGYIMGNGLTEENAELLQDFIDMLAEFATNPMTPENEFGIKHIALWEGPLNLQDGTELAPPGQFVDPLDIWYLPQLLEGMIGPSQSE
nr:MAG: BMP family ABC transporter substrate-binding protein [Chloroflexota bacterium]